GSQAWYGAISSGTSTARTLIEYNIVKWKDTQGNYISYYYSQNHNVSAITSIEWGGNEDLGKPHFNRISFGYIRRTLNETLYLKGIQLIQEKLLKEILVKTNTENTEVQFKKYVINYEDSTVFDNGFTKKIDYHFLKSVIEYNSKNEASNPITFNYTDLVTTIEEKPFSDFDDIITTGDYNGDGYIDFIVKQSTQGNKPEGYYIYFDAINDSSPSFVYLGAISKFQLGSFLTFNIKNANNHLEHKQGLVHATSSYINDYTTGNITLTYYSIKSDSSILNTYDDPLIVEYTKTIPATAFQFKDSYYPPYSTPGNYGISNFSQLITTKESDINSDGLSELILTIKDAKCFRSQNPPHNWSCNDLGYRYIIIDDDAIKDDTAYFLNNPTSKDILSKTTIMDFDNDGTQDILFLEKKNTTTNVNFHTKQGGTGEVAQQTVSTPLNSIYQYSLKRVHKGFYYLNLKNTYTIKGLTDHVMFGDLNGDGNIEILVPLHKNNQSSLYYSGWAIYLNTGSSLSEFCQGFSPFYKNENPSNTYQDYSYPGMVDIDNDGKSDFFDFYAGYNNQKNGFSNLILNKYSEFQYNPNDSKFKWSYKISKVFTNLKGGNSMYPLYGNFRVNNNNSKILFISKSLLNRNDRKIISYHHYDLAQGKKPILITQGSLKTEIEYREADPKVNPHLYRPVKKELYPFVELDKLSQSYVVSQLRQTIPVNGINTIRKQDFRYRGLVTHLHGKGMIGFRQTARSSWYADGFENTKIWSGAEIDPLREGVPIKEWSIKTNSESAIFPTNISLSNTQLLSVKLTDYKTDYFVDGVKKSTINPSEKARAITAMVPITSTSKDFQKDIKSVDTITYNDLYLPTKTVSNINDNFATSTTTLEYYPPNLTGVGNNYHVGRPKSKTELMTAYGDSKGAKEDYVYENNLLKTKTSWNRNNSGWIRETYTYDGFGNIIQKQLTNSIDSQSQTSKAEYEGKGRFVIKKNEISGSLNLETKITYNDWGQALTQTDAFGNTITNTYDAWGKTLTTKHNLSGTTAFLYEKLNNGDAKITENTPNGDTNITYTNKLGQTYKTTTKGFASGTYISKTIWYDALGRKIREYEPYDENGMDKGYNSITYDDFSRPVKAVSFTGKIIEN
ncbi:MAG: VCBS repeat-containing protein, partial [Cruoricaptor ignavus]|nr:VCBS repeat-containing protein [Cruoricaptor ignavus]